MKPRRLITWNSEDSCRKWHRDRGTEPHWIEHYVKNDMKAGNFLALGHVKEMVEHYDINVIGGV